MMELALPIVSKDKIFKRIDFGFIDKIGHELISRHDEVMFRSNAMGQAPPKRNEQEPTESFLFR